VPLQSTGGAFLLRYLHYWVQCSITMCVELCSVRASEPMQMCGTVYLVLHTLITASSQDRLSPAVSQSLISYLSADIVVLNSQHSHNSQLTNQYSISYCDISVWINHLQIDSLQIDSFQIHCLQINRLQIDCLQIDCFLMDCCQSNHHQIVRLQIVRFHIDHLQIDHLQIDHLQIDRLQVLLTF